MDSEYSTDIGNAIGVDRCHAWNRPSSSMADFEIEIIEKAGPLHDESNNLLNACPYSPPSVPINHQSRRRIRTSNGGSTDSGVGIGSAFTTSSSADSTSSASSSSSYSSLSSANSVYGLKLDWSSPSSETRLDYLDPHPNVERIPTFKSTMLDRLTSSPSITLDTSSIHSTSSRSSRVRSMVMADDRSPPSTAISLSGGPKQRQLTSVASLSSLSSSGSSTISHVINVNGLEFCRSHGMEKCGSCNVNLVEANNGLAYEIADTMNLSTATASELMDQFESRESICIYHMGAKPSPTDGRQTVCVHHSEIDCPECLDWHAFFRRRIAIFLEAYRNQRQRGTLLL